MSLTNEGIVFDNEKSYLKDGRKLQKVLAKALHRMCSIPIKETINDFQDVKSFKEQLNIEIQVYNLEKRQIYRGNENQIKVYIVMSEAHYDVISNLAGFFGANKDYNKAEYKKACKTKTKCDFEIDKVS